MPLFSLVARTRLRVFLTLCLAVILAGCGGGGNNGNVSNSGSAPTASALTITPTASTAFVGANVQYHAVMSFSDGTQRDLTSTVTWQSSDPTVATISNASGQQGLATTLNAGTVTISASAVGVTGATTLSVKAATPTQLSIEPATATVGVGQTRQLQAFAQLSDGTQTDVTSQVRWTSSSASATISNAAGSQGLVSAAQVGSTTITATGFGLAATASVTVTSLTVTAVDVAPSDLTLPLGTGDPLTATAIMSDGSEVDVTTTATWSSSAPGVATVNSSGRVQSVAAGQAGVTATFGGASGTSNVTVQQISPSPSPSPSPGASPSPSVSPSPNIPPVLVAIDVAPDGITVAKGTQLQYHATGIYSDGSQSDLTDDATWSSTPTSVATVDSSGFVTAVATGQATISAAFRGVSGSTTLNVSPAALVSIAVTPANQSIPVGLHQQYVATGTYDDSTTQVITNQVTWSTSPTDVLTISNTPGSQGLALCVGRGPATVTATLGAISGSTAATGTRAVLTTVTVAPDSITLSVGMRQQYTATATLSDGRQFNVTRDAVWSSSDPSVARVNDGRFAGRATARRPGDTNVTATLAGVVGSTPLHVERAPFIAIEVNPNPATVRNGRRIEFQAVAIFDGVFRVDVTDLCLWTSSDPTIATISTLFDPGRARGRSPGTVTITARFLLIYTGTATLTVQ